MIGIIEPYEDYFSPRVLKKSLWLKRTKRYRLKDRKKKVRGFLRKQRQRDKVKFYRFEIFEINEKTQRL